MKITKLLPLVCTILIGCNVVAQKSSTPTITKYLGEQIVIDSSATMILPIHNNSGMFSSMGGEHYVNLLFYNFKTDSVKKLFATDTYILPFTSTNFFDTKNRNKSMTSRYIFYRVKNVDFNKSGKIEGSDPVILYVSDKNGNNLKALTTENESVVSIEIFEKQNFALLKIQRDWDNDGNYEAEDKDYYYVKLDLSTFKLGKKIELK